MSIYGGPDIITDGLVLHLDAANSKSYPGSGTTWTDLSGNNYNGTLINGPIYNNDNKGSIVFDGTNDYVNLGNSNTITGNNLQTLTINMWIKYSSTSIMRPFTIQRLSGGANSSLLGVSVNESSSSLTPTIGRLGFFNRNFANNNHVWIVHNDAYHLKNKFINITCVIDNLNRYLYIDGVLKQSDSSVGLQSVSNNTDNTYIGCSPLVQQFYGGNIGLVCFYRRALNSTEIVNNYNMLKGRFGL